jgi:predicted N-acyltransferase
MDEQLAAELLAMKAEDQRVRNELARDASLFEGYHPRMEEVHRRNAARLREIIAERGWPGQSLVGQQATEAAWTLYTECEVNLV